MQPPDQMDPQGSGSLDPDVGIEGWTYPLDPHFAQTRYL